jgi:hypothetical protein
MSRFRWVGVISDFRGAFKVLDQPKRTFLSFGTRAHSDVFAWRGIQCPLLHTQISVSLGKLIRRIHSSYNRTAKQVPVFIQQEHRYSHVPSACLLCRDP